MSGMTNSRTTEPVEGGSPPPSSGAPTLMREGIRQASKGVFAAADLVLGPWPGPRVLIYHQIGAGSGRQMDVSAEMFRGHVSWLLDHGRIVEEGTPAEIFEKPQAARLRAFLSRLSSRGEIAVPRAVRRPTLAEAPTYGGARP